MRNLIKKTSVMLAATSLVLGAAACSAERTNGSSGVAESSGSAQNNDECQHSSDSVIGISMPTKSLERWSRDGGDLKDTLEKKDFEVDLQYADNKVDVQISQIENMVNAGADILVVASIDGEAMGPVLESAHEQGATVIAYDRLIMGTEAVDYYATFDNYQIGNMQGEYIVDALGLEDSDETHYLEMLSGSADDNNAYFYFGGAWDALEKYYEDEKLIVASDRVPKSKDDWQSISIAEWDGSKAQTEMENRLNSFYRDKKIDAVLSPNDSLALGVAEALSANGYDPDSDWPVITGQDADLANVLNMLDGKQTMTVWVDTRELGERVATMVEQIANCSEVDVNDTDTYDNDVKVVPSYLIDPIVVTPDSIEENLVDSGFYDKDELGLG